MSTCPICGAICSKNAIDCINCAFSDSLGIDRPIPTQEEAQYRLDALIKPYRQAWKTRLQNEMLLKENEQLKEQASTKMTHLPQPSYKQPSAFNKNSVGYIKDSHPPKPSINIGTIGHISHGKTTLTAAITETLYARYHLGQPLTVQMIDNTYEEQLYGYTIPATHVVYETLLHQYFHIDCPGHTSYTRKMIAGAALMDIAILVVAANEGVMSQTIEHLILARQVNVSNIIMFMNKCDLVDDKESLDLIEVEIRELLDRYDFSGDDIPILRGSALQAQCSPASDSGNCIIKLLEAVEANFKPPMREPHKPFVMSIEKVSTKNLEVDAVVTGRIERGIIVPQHKVEILGLSDEKNIAIVSSIEYHNDIVHKAHAGNIVSLSLNAILPDRNKYDIFGEVGTKIMRSMASDKFKRGQTLAQQNTIFPYAKLIAQVYFLSAHECGLNNQISNNSEALFYFRTTEVSGVIKLPNDKKWCNPGDHCSITIELKMPIVFDTGDRFAFRKDGRTIGAGSVVKIVL